MAPVVYLAGPEVFLPNAVELGAAKIECCRANGFDAQFPFEPDAHDGGLPLDAAHRIFEHCIATMDRCDLIIANMTPFRGVSMDVGTAVEVGYMYARSKPVFGYTNVAGDYATRVVEDGFVVEAFGLADNLMVEGPVWHSGGSIVCTDVAPADRLTDQRGFVACVQQAAALLMR